LTIVFGVGGQDSGVELVKLRGAKRFVAAIYISSTHIVVGVIVAAGSTHGDDLQLPIGGHGIAKVGPFVQAKCVGGT